MIETRGLEIHRADKKSNDVFPKCTRIVELNEMREELSIRLAFSIAACLWLVAERKWSAIFR